MRFVAVAVAPVLWVVACVVVAVKGTARGLAVSSGFDWSVIATSIDGALLSSSVTVSFANPGATTTTEVFAPRAGRGTLRTPSARVSLPR